MGFAVKSNNGVEVPQEEDLLYILRWWMKLCFGIGLPLDEPSYGFRVKLFILALVLGDLTVGVTSVVRLAIYDYEFILTTTANQISNTILCLNFFLMTCVFHAVVVWKLKDLNAVIQTLNRQVTVDLKLWKVLKTAEVLAIVFVVITQTASVITTAYAAYAESSVITTAFAVYAEAVSFKFWYTFLWTLWVAFIIYAEVMSYTISLLITALGYQFYLLRHAIGTRTFISWENLHERHIQLCKLSGDLQKCLHLILILLVGSAVVNICISAFFIAEDIIAKDISSDFTTMFIAMVKRGLSCVCLCTSADYLRDQANSLTLDLADAEMKCRLTPHAIKFRKAICNNVRNLQQLTSFSVGGFCCLGKPLLLTILAAAMSYFILLRQMKDMESGSSTNCTQICEYFSLMTTPKP